MDPIVAYVLRRLGRYSRFSEDFGHRMSGEIYLAGGMSLRDEED